jgi:hypothetical protein
VFDRGAQVDALGAEQVLDRCAQAVGRGTARCTSQEVYRGARRRYLIAAPRLLPAAPLVVRRR